MAPTDDLPEHSRSGIGFAFGVLQADAVPGPILVEVMATLGFAEPTTRQLLARMLRQGQLERRRVGRVSVYRLAGGYLERWSRLRYGDTPPPWTGAFHVVVHDIPERLRVRRERLLGAAARAGFGQPRPGLLIGLTAPEFVEQVPARADAAAPMIEVGMIEVGMVEVGMLSLDPDAARRMAATAWSLPARAADLHRAATDLERLLDRLAAEPRPEGTDALRLMFEAGTIAGSPRYSAPALPPDLLPADWPAQHVQDLLHHAIERLTPTVGEYLYRRLTVSPHADLVEGGWWPPLSAHTG
ncbi:MAG: PaaX family transcriptional regulator C-terminal domain-containing protein [Micropruina sp.]|uniref:hypothetical protein n=1 Tax=Micropruina sp. TaxID=2737536 RepID=UPI0039E2CE38